MQDNSIDIQRLKIQQNCKDIKNKHYEVKVVDGIKAVVFNDKVTLVADIVGGEALVGPVVECKGGLKSEWRPSGECSCERAAAKELGYTQRSWDDPQG